LGGASYNEKAQECCYNDILGLFVVRSSIEINVFCSAYFLIVKLNGSVIMCNSKVLTFKWWKLHHMV